MNLLMVIHYPIFGGPHNEALRLNAERLRRGWSTLVLLPDEPGNAAARLRAGGVDVLQMPLHRLRMSPDPRLQLGFGVGFAADIDRIRRLIRERQIDLVLVGGLVNPQAALAARLERTPVVWQILDSRAPAALRLVLMPVVSRLADAILFDGEGLIALHAGKRRLGVPAFVYYPPVDTQSFQPSPSQRRQTRQALGIPEDAPVVGMVANLNPQKGIEYFIRAAAAIYRSQPQSWFVVVGARYATHQAYTARLAAEARASGIPQERLIFTGEQPDVQHYYPAMDVKLITSVPRSEGTTTTAMEAMACGVPVVATGVGAVSEVVEDGVTGFVVPPLDSAAIARATLRLLEDRGLRTRMGQEARRRAVERYDASVCADTQIRAFDTAMAGGSVRAAARLQEPAPRAGTQKDLRGLLVCPDCRGALRWEAEEIHCGNCSRAYPILDGIPVLLLDSCAAEHDELEHQHGHDHKRRQAEYFDRGAAAEFEISRPHGAARLYGWLLGEKFRRSIAGLETKLSGTTALTVCGGSGMDAEFLARAGGAVIASDISLGAAQRTRERARRAGLNIVSIVADVERLPFHDRSVDLVYVHDGLHHLERPETGLAEMARVAARAVSVTEPARAAATAIAVRLGLALEREEAGNRVARVEPQEVAEQLRSAGFSVLTADRYAMYYPHEPGRIFRRLSLPGVLGATILVWRAANAALGRFGNKLAVVAVRTPVTGETLCGTAKEQWT